MDKLHYYVCLKDVNLSKYIERAETDLQLPRDDRTLLLMNSCSTNVESDDDEDEESEGEEGNDNNDVDESYDISESDTDSDASVDDEAEEDEEAAEAADTAAFVNEAIGHGSGQLRQVQPDLL